MTPHSHKRTLAICGSSWQQGHLRLLQRMLRLLAENGFKLVIHHQFYDYLHEAGVTFPEDSSRVDKVPNHIETVISVGGDGTFLNTARWVGHLPVPLVGVNTGHLGYLAQFGLDDMDTLASALKDRTLRREERMVLCLEVEGSNERHTALNEIAILKDDTSSMINVQTWVDSTFVARYRADGLILSTATGSTAYNMSAGGPLMQPTLETVILTPVAPHSLTQRPLVVSARSQIRAVTDTRAARYRVSVDGRSFTLPTDTALTVSRAPWKLAILMRPDMDFAATLRSKLGWAQS